MNNFKIKGFNGKFAYGYVKAEGQRNRWMVRTPSGDLWLSPGQHQSGACEFCNDLKSGVYGEVA